jgi:hypothetical protein
METIWLIVLLEMPCFRKAVYNYEAGLFFYSKVIVVFKKEIKIRQSGY